MARSRLRCWARRAAVAAAVALVGLQASAFLHAWRMTHFTESGSRTRKPEELSVARKAWTLLTGVTVPKPRNTRSPADYGLSFEGVSFRARDGVALSAWLLRPVEDNRPGPRRGDGLMVLMFHGYGSCKSALLPQARMLSEEGCGVLLVDLRGCGDSEGRVTTLGWHEAEDVAAAAEWARQRFPRIRPVLFGSSLGAAAVLRAVATQKAGAVSGLILESPFDRLLNTVRHRFEAMRLPSFPAAESLVLWGGLQHGANGFRINPADFARRVPVPMLVLNGTNDPRVRVEEARRVAHNAAGPAEFRVFPITVHDSLYEADPAAYRRTVADWLERLRQPADR